MQDLGPTETKGAEIQGQKVGEGPQEPLKEDAAQGQK